MYRHKAFSAQTQTGSGTFVDIEGVPLRWPDGPMKGKDIGPSDHC